MLPMSLRAAFFSTDSFRGTLSPDEIILVLQGRAEVDDADHTRDLLAMAPNERSPTPSSSPVWAVLRRARRTAHHPFRS